VRSVGISCCQSWWMSIRRGQPWLWVEGASRRSCFEGFACYACQEHGSGSQFDLAARGGLAALGVGCGHQNRALLFLFFVVPPIPQLSAGLGRRKHLPRAASPPPPGKRRLCPLAFVRAHGQKLRLRLTVEAERLRAAAGKNEYGSPASFCRDELPRPSSFLELKTRGEMLGKVFKNS